LVLSGFPPAMMFVICMTSRGFTGIEVTLASTMLLSCLLSLLLWAAPVLHTELEGKTWVYLAARPYGRFTSVIGKFLMAVIWTIAVCWVSLVTSLMVLSVYGLTQSLVWNLLLSFGLLSLLASFVYASIFACMGVIFHRRAINFSATYALVVEFMIAMVPAVIGRCSVRHHLTSMAFSIMDIDKGAKSAWASIYGQPSFVWSLAMLGAIMGAWLTVGLVTLWTREYVTADEA
jgi:hypothetical protein